MSHVHVLSAMYKKLMITTLAYFTILFLLFLGLAKCENLFYSISNSFMPFDLNLISFEKTTVKSIEWVIGFLLMDILKFVLKVKDILLL